MDYLKIQLIVKNETYKAMHSGLHYDIVGFGGEVIAHWQGSNLTLR
jgi:hypothetical protein